MEYAGVKTHLNSSHKAERQGAKGFNFLINSPNNYNIKASYSQNVQHCLARQGKSSKVWLARPSFVYKPHGEASCK